MHIYKTGYNHCEWVNLVKYSDKIFLINIVNQYEYAFEKKRKKNYDN